MELQIKKIYTDFLIIGGGTAGCWAALAFSKISDKKVLIVEKANIKRSGCLAAGVNALNAYIAPEKTPQDYVDYARADAAGIVRGDLLLTMAQGLNRAVNDLEKAGLTILKDEQGKYAMRGERNVKINGENIKPILAQKILSNPQISVLNKVNAFEYIVLGNRICGVYAIKIDEPVLYVIYAKAVLCSTGGACGLYKPNNPGFSQHKMWYPPFNTGAGYAMGILAGAEMTTLEMRFVALRCKDTIAPTGTLAQGIGAKQINSFGEVYENKYGISTSQRIYGTVAENLEGRGPCFLKTSGISKLQEFDLYKAYLNMAPLQTLKWIENGKGPSIENVEIEGTEPYIVGGHTASGYWVSTARETTIKGLFAAGDVAGGCPQKYVSGALAEGEIAAKSAVKYMDDSFFEIDDNEINQRKYWLESFLNRLKADFSTDELEEEMQEVMDKYAGGISSHYSFSEKSLKIADKKIIEIERKIEKLAAFDMMGLIYILELKERLTLCRAVIAHLAARKETRWHIFAENSDYPECDEKWNLYVNSKMENGKLNIILRPLVKEGEFYEH
ncbi:MAG: adenylyl-sulfate reductase subunit alpha [Oscillospiraceae bacterium]|nr:adenylyl-sulfate reductase subunit alpha [Oscillospiraceae bacterium]